MPVFHSGTSEQGWLADLKETAEQVGLQVFGEAIRWDVEGLLSGSQRRPDVVIRRDRDGTVLASGEAKRPEAPEGVHPLVSSEVRDAIEKAQILHAPLCFTTNFFDFAVFDARTRAYGSDLDRLQGGLISLVPSGSATAPGWWSVLPTGERSRLTVMGLRQLFERLRASERATVARNINEVTLHVFSRTTDRLLTPLFEALIAQREAAGLPGAVFAHGLRVHLNPADDSEARFLVAQGIAEVLTATLFYRNISEHFSLNELLAGTSPRTATGLFNRVRASLQVAITRAGDYDTIFELSPIAQWVLAHGGEPVLRQWQALFAFVEQLDFTSVTSDVIGSIFERLISPERRHAMGQHYTDARVASSICRWAVRSPNATVADIACGAGTFLVEAYKQFAAHGREHSQVLQQVFGNDLDPFAVHLATVNLATRDIYRGANYPAVRLGDANELRPGGIMVSVSPTIGNRVEIKFPPDGVDVVVGNPPFATAPSDPASITAALVSLGHRPPTGMAGNLAAWFALLAAALTRRGGSWGLVLPTSVLQNGNLAPWRRWLRSAYDVVVWHTEDDVWFSDARVATCVVLASASRNERKSLHFVDIRSRIEGELLEVDGVPSASQNASVRDLSGLEHQADIYIAGVYPDVFKVFRSSERVALLAEVEGVSIFSGNKLGHAMYQLRDLAPTRSGVLRDLEAQQMRLKLNRSYLLPLFRSPMDERTGEFRQSEYWVLNAPKILPSTGALRAYVDHCKSVGVQSRPSVRQRGSHWWSVEWRASQIAVQIHPGFSHQVWWSAEPFVAKNNFHVLEFRDQTPSSDRELIAASLASGFGALGALFLSSEVGCEGVRWLSTEQFGQWPVISPVTISREDREAVLRAYRLFRRLGAQEIHLMDQETHGAWHTLTAAVAQAAGLPRPEEVATDVIELARQTCVRRANREALALSGRIRSGVHSGTFAKHIQTKLNTSALAPQMIERLTGGDRLVRIRSEQATVQGSFSFDADESVFPGEASLSRVLSEGFECAPTTPAEEDPDALARDLGRLLNELTDELIGPTPPGGDAGTTHRELSNSIRRTAVEWLQHQVQRRLH